MSGWCYFEFEDLSASAAAAAAGKKTGAKDEITKETTNLIYYYNTKLRLSSSLSLLSLSS